VPYNGQVPKPEGERQRRNRPAYDGIQIESDDIIRGFELPDLGFEWHERTIVWWETWRSAPQSKLMTETDWQFLIETALLHHRLFTMSQRMSAGQLMQVASELRQREGQLGATWSDRAKMRIKIDNVYDYLPKEEQKNRTVDFHDEYMRLITEAEKLTQEANGDATSGDS